MYLCFFPGEVTVSLNFQLVLDTDFNSDLLNRSSNKFMAMEENIKMEVREGLTCLEGFCALMSRFFSYHTYRSTKKAGI